MTWEGQRRGRQLDRIRTISHQQDHFDPDDVHGGQRALPHRDRSTRRPAHLHRPPAHGRAPSWRLLERTPDGHYRAGPATAHDGGRPDACPPNIAERAPCVLEDLSAATKQPRPARRPAGTRGRLHREAARTPARHRVQPRRDAARPPDRARPRPAGLLPARRRRNDDHARAAAVHRAHHDLPRPIPPRPGGHPTHPRGRHPLSSSKPASAASPCRSSDPAATRRRASNSPCSDLGPALQTIWRSSPSPPAASPANCAGERPAAGARAGR